VRRTVGQRVSEARVAQWRQVFDTVFSSADRVVDDDGMDITGWHAGHDGSPIPFADMRSWLAATVGGLRSRLPRNARVLEIGCATGLVLFELAPGCARYVGVDFSAPALAELRRRLSRRDLPQVELYEARAGALPATLSGFDAVVLASVVQYLPGEDDLRRVLTEALGRLSPGGFVFVGDVRSLPLLDTLHVHHAGKAGAVPARAIQDELVIHPAFFERFAEQAGAVVEIEPRGGRRAGELTAYRYDVVLRRAEDAPAPVPVEWHPWDTTARLEALLTTTRPAEIGLTGVPHLLLADDLRAHAALSAQAPAVPRGEAVLPDDLRRLARNHGYRAVLSCAQGSPDGAFDVWLTRTGDARPRWPRRPYRGPLTNDPAGREATDKALTRVHAFLASHLAEYLVPRSLVAVDTFPTTAHWRVDRAGRIG
jgi:SAM-dependent methyltransferase